MRTDDRGESLLELLVAIAILGVAVAAIVGGIGASTMMSDVHRKQATAGAGVRDFGEAIENQVMAGGYVPCAAPAKYAAPAGFTVPAGFSSTVTSVKYWTGSAWSATCGADTGLQQLTVQVASGDGRASERLEVVVRKRCGLGEAPC